VRLARDITNGECQRGIIEPERRPASVDFTEQIGEDPSNVARNFTAAVASSSAPVLDRARQ
jgi:hypothetical protein